MFKVDLKSLIGNSTLNMNLLKKILQKYMMINMP